MAGRYLLDTNIIIDLFNGEKKIVQFISKAAEIFITSSSVINSNIETSKIYGLIKNNLKKKGTPIPENDIWIASIAKQFNLILVTRDKHFSNIKDIDIEIL